MFDRKKSIEEKNKAQKAAVEGSKHYQHLMLSWATGCGKTLGSLKIIKSLFDNNDKIQGYLICSEENHIDNWEEDIKEHSMDFFNNCSKKFLYASLHKYSDKGIVDFLILDEIHNITEKRLEHLRKIIGPNTRVIMLSATFPEKKYWMLKSLLKSYGEYHISLSEAIKVGILPHPIVYIHYYELDNEVKNKSLTLKTEYKKEKTYLHLTEKSVYNMISQEIEKYGRIYEENPSKKWAKNLQVNLGNKRKTLMANFKTERALGLRDKKLNKVRHIIFSGTKEQAEILSKNYVHSGNDKKHNISLKNKFNNGELDSLSLVKMFREGMNLKNIKKGLIVQLDNVKLSFIQMLGRVFRSDIPEMHVMVFKDTQDENYLKNVLYGFNTEYIKYVYH